MSYYFWIETYEGGHTYWRHLTKAEAKAMYSATDKHTPENVKRFGWEEIK